mgnify:CR=1 FL=1
MMTIREYARPATLEEAWQLNQKKPNRVLGGMLWLKMEKINVGTAIDLSALGLDTIEETDTEIIIGAMATLRDLETNAALNAYTAGAVREAVRHIVGVQFRNCATVGGSIYGRFGFSDVLTLFLALDCEVELYRAGRMPLAQFAAMPYDRDILTHICLRKTPGLKVQYQSVRATQTDFPILTCAAARTAQGQYRFAIGARRACHAGLRPGAAARRRAGSRQDRQQPAWQCRVPHPPDRCAGPACRGRAGKLTEVYHADHIYLKS